MNYYNSSIDGAMGQWGAIVPIGVYLRAVTLEIQMGAGQYMCPPM